MNNQDKIETYDEMQYEMYTFRSQFEKSLYTLIGIIEGIRSDSVITVEEKEELVNWCMVHNEFKTKEPFKSIIALINNSLSDDILTDEEIEEILYACKNQNQNNPYYDLITNSLQELSGILHGILSDNVVNTEEITELKKWLQENDYLENTFPYAEVYSVVHKVLEDNMVDHEEEKMLKVFFSEFVDQRNSINIDTPALAELKATIKISGICSLAPEIDFKEKTFCFTGASSKATRSEIAHKVLSSGGLFTDSLNKKVDYLIIGNEGNPCWAFTCYGRKVEKAMVMRREGHKIILVNEIDFWDALVV